MIYHYEKGAVWEEVLEHDRQYCARVLKNHPTDKAIQKYQFHPDRLNLAHRKKGISGLLTLFGAAYNNPYLIDVIESSLKFMDEIIMVYTEPSRAIVELRERFERKYPERFLSYHYNTCVYPYNSPRWRKEPYFSINTPVGMRNYAITKSHYTVVTKCDYDHIFLDIDAGVKERMVNQLDSGEVGTIYYSGLNIINKSGKLYIPMITPYSGNRDIGLHNIVRGPYFRGRLGARNFDAIMPLYSQSTYFSDELFYVHLRHLMRPPKGDSRSNRFLLTERPIRELQLVSLSELKRHPDSYFKHFNTHHDRDLKYNALIKRIDTIIAMEKELVDRSVAHVDSR